MVTLGALLYIDTAPTPVPEKDWVGLVQSIAAGDQRALRALYERTHRIVFTLIMRITNDREIAEEVTVDVFHDVWSRASTYDAAGGSVVGWIMNQARSRAVDRFRTSDPRTTGDLEEQSRLLRQALTALTPAERQAIETAFFSELTYQDVATRLNQPLGTVKTRVRSGLMKLRWALAETVKRP